MRLRGVVLAARRRRAVRRADGCAARPVGRGSREDRAGGRGPLGRALRVSPRLPRATRSIPVATTSAGRSELTKGTAPTVYAHVAAEPGRPGKLSLQYWLYYVFNDWNNTHEGDWEMIQLVFDAADAAEALERRPAIVGYSQHEGAERADWGDDKLELVGGTHPVVYPAAGSHANFFDDGAVTSAAPPPRAWVATTRPGRVVELRPDVRTISERSRGGAASGSPGSRSRAAGASSSGASSTGRPAPTSSPSGRDPSSGPRAGASRSIAVPGGGALGTGATDFFCGAVAAGSNALRRAIEGAADVAARPDRRRSADRLSAHAYVVDARRSAAARPPTGLGSGARVHVRACTSGDCRSSSASASSPCPSPSP